MKFNKILFISDMHLIHKKPFLGIDTFKSLGAIVDHISNSGQVFDHIFLLGDFVQDQSERSFEFLNQKLKKIDAPKSFIRGNHDIKDTLPINGYKDVNDIVKFNNWIFSPIDSFVQNNIYGLITDEEISKIDKLLRSNKENWFIFYMHHNLFETNSPWLDIHITKNHKEVVNFLSAHENFKVHISGHVHQFSVNNVDNSHFYTIPSTSAQFKKDTEEFTLDQIQPGYCILEINEDGSHKMTVVRVQGFFGKPDKNPKTY
jgi:Icc protein